MTQQDINASLLLLKSRAKSSMSVTHAINILQSVHFFDEDSDLRNAKDRLMTDIYYFEQQVRIRLESQPAPGLAEDYKTSESLVDIDDVI